MSAADRAMKILEQAPDLNLDDYSKNQVKKLVRAMQRAYAELSAGKYPESVRTDREGTSENE